MIHSTSLPSPRPFLLGAAALVLGGLLLAACNTTSSPGPQGCVGPDSVCVTRQALRDTGEYIFTQNSCAGCHGADARGGRGPTIANSDWFMNHRTEAITLVLRGNYETPPYIDTLNVNGVKWPGGSMPPWRSTFSDYEIAGILTYLRSVKNDSLVGPCTPPSHPDSLPSCVKTARDPAVMDKDTVAPWEVAAIRATLPPLEE